MATIFDANFYLETPDSDLPLGRVAFLTERPDIYAVYQTYREPGSVFAYYNQANGFAELFVVDPSGYKFMALG